MTLFYPFPHIRHIDDVLPHIDEGFRSIEKDGLIFINYNNLSPDVFPPVVAPQGHIEGRPYMIDRLEGMLAYAAAVRRECRGITFDAASGAIVSRPLHKFFNVNERPDVTVDLLGDVREHVVIEKLDGSMVRPLFIGGGLRWGTKMGVTDTAMLAEEFAADKPQYRAFAEACREAHLTPVFEFCSRRARIVVDYPEDQMVLLAVRGLFSGKYVARSGLETLAREYGIPVVGSWGGNDGSDALIQRVRNMDTGEGIVLNVGGGHAVKIKADAYVQLHKAKDHLRTEMDLLDLVFNERLDDVLPILSNDEQDRVWQFLRRFNSELARVGDRIDESFDASKVLYSERKDFAIDSIMAQPWKGRVLDLWNGKFANGLDAITTTIKRLMSAGEYGQPGYKHRSALSAYSAVKEAYGMNTGWDNIMYGKEDE